MNETAENVLLVVLDTVRAKSTFLNGKETTPTLRLLAEDGLTFENAIAPAPWTLPSHASMFTGYHPSEHGVITQSSRLSTAIPTVAERLQQAGFDTGLFTANMFLSEHFGLANGFDYVRYIERTENRLFNDAFDPVGYIRRRNAGEAPSLPKELFHGPVLKNLANALYYKASSRLRTTHGNPPDWDDVAVDEFLTFAEADHQDGFFATVNLIQAHAPWDFDPEVLRANDIVPSDIAPPERWKEVASNSSEQWRHAAGEIEFDDTDQRILEALYESWIHNVDSLVSRIRTGLADLGLLEDTLIIITADHGERLAVDGILGHTYTVHPDVSHVPLVCRYPAISGGSVSAPVSLKDIYGTILQQTGLETEAASLFNVDTRGRAFAEAAGADPDRIASLVGEEYRSVARQFDARSAIWTEEGHAEIRHGSEERLGDADVLDELEDFISQLERAETGNETEVPDHISDRLEYLGYR